MSRQCWSSVQLARFLAVARGGRLEAAWHLSALGGLRTSELLALRWGDINRDAEWLTAHQACLGVPYSVIAPPLQYDRERVVSLDLELRAVLYAHWERQQAERSEWGADYAAHDLVMCEENGWPLDPRALNRAFATLVGDAGLPPVRLSSLRLAGMVRSTAGGQFT